MIDGLYSPVYTGPPLEVDSNPDSGPHSTGGLRALYLDCDLDYMEFRFGSEKVVPGLCYMRERSYDDMPT